jgi:hypothetical protein
MQLKHTFNSPKIAQLLLQGNETHLSIAVVLVPSLRVEEVVLKLPPIIHQVTGTLHIQGKWQQ